MQDREPGNVYGGLWRRVLREVVQTEIKRLTQNSALVGRWVKGDHIRGPIPITSVTAHKTSHENGGADELSVAGLSGQLADDQNPTAHKTDHENGGGDEISVAGLSGQLADGQTPVNHDHSGDGGDGGTFDAANLTSGAATDGQVLTADGAGGAGWEAPTGGGLTVKEVDGAPSVGTVTEIRVTNGKLTDVGGGVVSIDLSGDAGSPDASTVTYTPAVATDWNTDADPGDVDNALDQLAERVDDLEAAGGGGAPTDADYIVETANAGLSAESVLGTTVVTTAAYASRQAAAKAGRLYLPSDGFYLERDTGAAWAPWGPIFPMTPPVAGDFAWINQGGASVDATYGGIYLLAPAGAGDSFHIQKKAAPATPYTVTVAFLTHFHGANYQQVGMVLRQSSDGKLVAFVLSYNGGFRLSVDKFTNATTWSANYGYVPLGSGLSAPVFMRVSDAGVGGARVCSWSADGRHFHAFHSVARNDFLIADEVGFTANANNAAYPAGVTLLSWKEA